MQQSIYDMSHKPFFLALFWKFVTEHIKVEEKNDNVNWENSIKWNDMHANAYYYD